MNPEAQKMLLAAAARFDRVRTECLKSCSQGCLKACESCLVERMKSEPSVLGNAPATQVLAQSESTSQDVA